MSDDRLASLRGLRDLLLASLEAADAHQRAPLAAQYRATLAEIAELTQEGAGSVEGETSKGTPLDELRKLRAARESRASG